MVGRRKERERVSTERTERHEKAEREERGSGGSADGSVRVRIPELSRGTGKGKGERPTSGLCRTPGTVRQTLVPKRKRRGLGDILGEGQITITSHEHGGRTTLHRFDVFIKIGRGGRRTQREREGTRTGEIQRYQKRYIAGTRRIRNTTIRRIGRTRRRTIHDSTYKVAKWMIR